MPLFPPAAPVTVLVDGRPLTAYVHAFVAHGRVMAAVSPLLRRLADRMWLEGGMLVVEGNGRRVRVPFALRVPGDPGDSFVAIGPLLRALGDEVRYRRNGRYLEIRTPSTVPVASPTPFGGAAPSAPPRQVFTPEPIITPRPAWSGSPLPRRTPLPVPTRRGRRV